MSKEKIRFQKLRRIQLDDTYKDFYPLVKNLSGKSGGWIKEIRNAFGISSTQFAKLLGISSPAFLKLEASEEKQTIELQTLRRVAAAIDCQLVYAIVPSPEFGSLESILKKQSLAAATKVVTRIAKTMALEDQAVREKELNRQIQELAEEMARSLDKRLWERE
jgi:predicted DNA-binding mobile mystery protein A